MNEVQVHLPVFEGPLDLLLHLVKKHELDVLDIPVAFITEKYLEYLEIMRKLSLDVAGEYLLMAATLAHLKSRELLPTPEVGPDEELPEDEADPRQELIRRLLEYQKYKSAAASLEARPVVGRNVFIRGMAMGEEGGEDSPLAEVPVFKLIEALSDVLKKARVKLSHDITVERLNIADRIRELAERLDREGAFSFSSCFAFVEPAEGAEARGAAQLRHDIVVTFLAILEMTRLKMILIAQGDNDILVTRAVAAA
ncbi:MAG TPA: segregation/condensation protein A [Haliangiales bacterium]|nr:segregation/condensation protein A [Haliangiales bacterium]